MPFYPRLCSSRHNLYGLGAPEIARRDQVWRDAMAPEPAWPSAKNWKISGSERGPVSPFAATGCGAMGGGG